LLLLGMSEAQVERVERAGRTEPLQSVVAPIAGVIVELAIRPGMTVAPGMTLARINGIGTLWLEAAVPEALAAAVRPGAMVQARLPAWPGEVFTGRVAALLPEANREARTLRVRIELPNRDGRLKAGMSAQVQIAGAQRDALVVPAEAVIRTGRRAIVYLAEEGGRFRPTEVELGEQVGDALVVRSGLAAGQQVVASGQFLLDSEASLQGVLARAAAPASAPASKPAVMQMQDPQADHAGHAGHAAAVAASGAAK
ncbi:MAG TPA: efflux RND transporter periplasmic adaptor subunit, partial [Burkholderiaceae bacterium]|nr:efflux RND transporter periplasmic adaptor subunit [Burkholderiaceae bacterium]